MNSGVTTELTSSSNGRIGEWYWQGWACGVNGTIIKSIGSSSVWRNVSGNGVPSNVLLDNICGVDSSIAFVTGHLNANTWVWKTSNGGQNWIQVFNQSNGRINAVWMRNSQIGIMQGNPVGGRWSIWKTSNGGNTWDSAGLFLPQAGNELGWPNSLCMPMGSFPSPPAGDSNKIWFGTNNYRIYYSTNYGQNWSIQPLPLEQNIFCIAYGMDYSGTTLYAGGSNKLFKSTNFGTNWITDSIGGTGNIKGITFAWFSSYLIRENKIYTKFSNWNLFYTAPAGSYNYLDNRGHGLWYDHYAVRTNGGITFISEGEGVQKISSEMPELFSLSQNYPNPFNPITKIKFSLPAVGERHAFHTTKLIIYDVLGREITTLVNERLSPGTYEVEWSATGGAGNYPSGVYFYKLITAEYSETRKMVLVK
jgi:photosystem II stability/assembly factor-like uncharacterized protein